MVKIDLNETFKMEVEWEGTLFSFEGKAACQSLMKSLQELYVD